MSSPGQERRQHVRFPQTLEIHARGLMSGAGHSSPPKEFHGRIHNLSNGGACIISSCALQAATFVCCEFPVTDVAATIPTLMQVRWSENRGGKSNSYISGLQFVV